MRQRRRPCARSVPAVCLCNVVPYLTVRDGTAESHQPSRMVVSCLFAAAWEYPRFPAALRSVFWGGSESSRGLVVPPFVVGCSCVLPLGLARCQPDEAFLLCGDPVAYPPPPPCLRDLSSVAGSCLSRPSSSPLSCRNAAAGAKTPSTRLRRTAYRAMWRFTGATGRQLYDATQPLSGCGPARACHPTGD